MSTAAFQGEQAQIELARILIELAGKILRGEMRVCTSRKLYDMNGIQVGAASIETEQ